VFFYHLVTPPTHVDEMRLLRAAYESVLDLLLTRCPNNTYRRLALSALHTSLMLGLLAWRLAPRENV
jgi:hypothetical protein